MTGHSLVREIAELVTTRYWARLQGEIEEALGHAGLSLGGNHPLADLEDSARAELARLAERLEIGQPQEDQEILAALQALADEIRPYDFELMIEGYLPTSQAGHLCRELESLLDPEGDITPTPGALRAAATVSCDRLWSGWLATVRSRK